MLMPRGSGARARRDASRGGADVEGVNKALDDGSLTASALLDPAAADTALAAIADFAGQSMTAFDGVEYAGVPGEDFAVVGFDPSDDRFEAALAELVARAPEAEPLVRASFEEMRLRRFVAVDSPAPPITPPIDARGELFTLEWEAVLCPEGVLTEDGRAFAPGSMEWRELPLSLAAMLETQPGHDGATVCGRIDRIWRDEAAGLIRAAGVFDNSDYGREIARMVADRVLCGNSVDIAPLEVETGPASRWFDDEGAWIPQEAASAPAEEPSLEDILFGDPLGEKPIVVVNRGVIGMSTVCPFPAFAGARIGVGESLAASGNPLVWTLKVDAGYRLTRKAKPAPALTAAAVVTILPADVLDFDAIAARFGITNAEVAKRVEALTAAAALAPPVAPPSAWFANPELEQLLPLVVTDDGRIYGHAAGWGSCHTGFSDVCVMPPHSETDYRFYHLKSVVTAEDTEVGCGTITLEAPHANQQMGLVEAQAHYDHTGMAVADICVGEDEHGIWVAGALRPGLTPEVIRELRGASLSGDWRNYEGNLELVALLAVNVPGFPIPRVQARVASGVMQTLIAAGVQEATDVITTTVAGFSVIAARPSTGPNGVAEWSPPKVSELTAAKLRALASPELSRIAG